MGQFSMEISGHAGSVLSGNQQPSGSDGDQAAEIRRLKQELARVTEERDILKKATAYFA